MTLYNEIEPYAAAWLRNLSDAGHIARGGVDVRSIRELRATDVVGATQFHAFAGLGAWSYALRLAGWPDDRPVWTGSCPCQPFSVAGKGRGTADERHLWPEWFRLIRECRPVTIFGEQVASPDGLAWLDAVHADLEGEGYTVGAAVLPAAGIGAPHGRHRIFFGATIGGVAHAAPRGLALERIGRVLDGERAALGHDVDGRGAVRAMADAERGDGLREHRHGMGGAARGGQGEGDQRERVRVDPADGGAVGDVADARREGRREVGALARGSRARGAAEGLGERPMHGGDGDVADPNDAGLEGRHRPGLVELRGAAQPVRPVGAGGVADAAWSCVDWLPCRDGKARPVEPGTFPLAHGAPARVGRLRAYGNAIVPQVAAAFIWAFMEAT